MCDNEKPHVFLFVSVILSVGILFSVIGKWNFDNYQVAVATCKAAQTQHRLIYPLARCIQSEMQNQEDK